MSERLLYENILGAINESTNPADIAQTAPKLGFGHSIASKTLPALLGYVQPLSSPSGFIFAMKSGPASNQTTDMPFLSNSSGNPITGTAGVDDLQITRTPVMTGVREVFLDSSEELSQDIERLFGDEFRHLINTYLYYDDLAPEFETSSEGKLSKVFMEYSTWKMFRKTNADFCTWLSTKAYDLGSLDITTYEEIGLLLGAVGEMKDYLFTQTGKTGRTWILASPKIINHLLMLQTNSVADNRAGRENKRVPNSLDISYSFTIGEIDFYQDVNITNKMYAGITGSPGETSIFYTPFKEYFIQTAGDFNTGQSNLIYRLRDAFSLNPLDNQAVNQSKFICSADITFSVNNILS